MRRFRLYNDTDQRLADAWNLYEQSFPSEERRSWHLQQEIMKHESYHFDLILVDEAFVGILLWWEFETIRYIEHFAISSTQRNSGLGKRCLEAFLAESHQQVLLEVEKPEDSLKQRRIGFYERIGFYLNNYDYAQPPYQEGGPFVELLLMSYPAALSEADFQVFLTECHPIIHHPYFEKNPG
ncbi:GNAT family N-acetyltransferase [uncultured Sunxiuqinia sp.]|uniref:GNAT family N-acetyltransferase n=1 Tax=uncultured Sunxiuqinia sp. TaxID=1573825 RepID=UPI00263647CA|nr:GNAT family N-acetyltransferase [uncultured Sunxiuqinia sp.]